MLKRTRNQMPDDVEKAMTAAGVTKDFAARPAYQCNDYIGWIGTSKTDATRKRRLTKMIGELRNGGIYMGMEHRPSAKH